LKSVIIDWITPANGILVPPLQRNVKTDRGFHHPRTGELLCPVQLDWEDHKYVCLLFYDATEALDPFNTLTFNAGYAKNFAQAF
jgi:hypothetical protein